MKRLELNKELLEATLKEMTMEEAARKFGVSGQTIKRRIKEFGIDYNAKEQTSFAHILTKDYLESVKDTHTIFDVSEETGIKVRTVRKYIDQYGIKLVPRVLRGAESPMWKGGVSIKNKGGKQYRTFYATGEDGKGTYVFEHTLVMEEHIGRKLVKGEVVHHIDGDGLNNSIDNLVLMTKKQHDTFHRLLGLLRIDHRTMTKEQVIRMIDVTTIGSIRAYIRDLIMD